MLLSINLYSSDKIRGMFTTLSVGPRLPIGAFSEKVNIGYGFELELSYTDNGYLPIFIYGKLGYDQFIGAQGYYQKTDYSNFSSAMVPISVGARYYFSPVIENVVLILPIVEVAGKFIIFQNLHQFKSGSLRNNYLEEGTLFGFNVGVGVSMFLAEATLSYNFQQNYDYLSFDLKVRLPLFISF